MKTKNIKKLGYGVGIHYNEYSSKFEVYRLGSYSPGNGALENSQFSTHKSLKKALKIYRKKYLEGQNFLDI